MISSYLRTAFRNMRRQKLYTAINLIGLSVTLMVCILIFLFVRNEFSYDTFFKDHQHIFRVLGVSRGVTWGRVNIPWGEAVKEIPQINSFTRIWEEEGIVKRENVGFKETVTMVDSDFFKAMPFPLEYGNPSTALDDIHSVVLSWEMAEKLFGSQNPIGKTVSIEVGFSFRDYIVSGVAAKIPFNSSIRFAALIPYSNVKYTLFGIFVQKFVSSAGGWGVSNVAPSVFLRLNNSSDKQSVENLLQILMKDYLGRYQLGKTRFVLQPISDIHLSQDIAWNMQRASSPLYSYILLGLGLLILIVSSINYVNLTIARTSHRFKEIGVRKVIGASRRELISQFMGEALILSTLSLVIAVAATELLLPAFNHLTGREIIFSLFGDWLTIAGLLVITLVLGIVSGSYPALYLSRLNVTGILSGNQKMSGRKTVTRVITVFQFVVSAGLLVCAAIMFQQFNYMQSRNLGFDKENVLVISNPFLNNNGVYMENLANSSLTTFMSEISRSSGVVGVTSSTDMPGRSFKYTAGAAFGKDTCDAFVYTVGRNYLKTLRINLTSGRDFSERFATDTTDNVIVNETLVRELHISRPVGKVISLPYSQGKWRQVRIIGVVHDFNYESLNRKISPVVLDFSPYRSCNYVIARLKSGDIFSTMSFIRREWNKVLPGMPFDYNFLDDYLNSLYSSAERWHKIIDYSTTLAILIALMGLFGLASYSVERRTKEMGIRRIMGAKSRDVLVLIYGEFFWLILVATVLACPAAWYFMHRWLQDFAYRIDITIWPFVFTSLAILLATLVVTMVHVVRAARANPVESLRYE